MINNRIFENEKIKEYVKQTICKASLASQEEWSNYDIGSYSGYIYLDSSDIFERCSDSPYPKVLIDSCVELCLYRDGFYKTAEEYHKITIKE